MSDTKKYTHEEVPAKLPAVLDGLGSAVDALRDELARGVDPVRTRALLRTSAAETDSLLAVDDFSVRVMVAQLRSIVVDLLVAAGVTRSDALSALPPL